MGVLFTHVSGLNRGRVDRFSGITERIRIGRAVDCEVRVSPMDTVVSSNHAVVTLTPRGYVIPTTGPVAGGRSATDRRVPPYFVALFSAPPTLDRLRAAVFAASWHVIHCACWTPLMGRLLKEVSSSVRQFVSSS